MTPDLSLSLSPSPSQTVATPRSNSHSRLHDTRRAAVLDLLAVDTRGGRTDDALARLVAALVVDVLDVVGVDVAGEVAARARLVLGKEKRRGEERIGKAKG
jgi:hypothetical protein